MNGEDLGCHTYTYQLKNELTPVIDPDRGYLSGREHNRLYQEGDKTRGHERRCPDQIEVEPRLTEKREAELSIDHPSDQTCDRKIGNRMHTRGEHPDQRAGGRRYVIMARNSALCFNSVTAQQHWPHHQTGTVRRGHQKRPEGQVSEAYL